MIEFVRWLGRLKPLSLSAACGWIVGTTVVLFAVGSMFELVRKGKGMEGVAAVGAAAVICCAGAVMALVVTAKLRGPHRALWSLLVGTLFRMVFPFAAGLFLTQMNGALAQAGVFGWIVVFYLPLLIIETVFSVRFLQAGLGSPRGS